MSTWVGGVEGGVQAAALSVHFVTAGRTVSRERHMAGSLGGPTLAQGQSQSGHLRAEANSLLQGHGESLRSRAVSFGPALNDFPKLPRELQLYRIAWQAVQAL